MSENDGRGSVDQATRSGRFGAFSWENAAWGIGPIVLGLILTTLALIIVGADPWQAYSVMIDGAFGNSAKVSTVVLAWTPLLLASVGLLITFTAGLWNIGVEGQIIIGATGAVWVSRAFDLPPPLLIPLLFVGGAIFGAAWALLAGLMKTYGHVHEIFGGLGLNFVATGIAVYLTLGPWARPGVASPYSAGFMRDSAWLPTFAQGLAVGPIEIIVAVVSLVIVFVALRGTLWGLKLKAIGKNTRSAFWLGIPTSRHMLAAFALCGAFAGMAGTVQAAGVWHKYTSSISQGYGYLGILVVLLSGFQAGAVPFVALFFVAVMQGSVPLQSSMHLDPALGGVLEGIIVLLVVLGQGVQARVQRRGISARVDSAFLTSPIGQGTAVVEKRA
jgi:simple sugar transport system permease protein